MDAVYTVEWLSLWPQLSQTYLHIFFSYYHTLYSVLCSLFSSETKIMRRYSEFTMLASALYCYFYYSHLLNSLPSLPGKVFNPFTKQLSPEFLEERRHGMFIVYAWLCRFYTYVCVAGVSWECGCVVGWTCNMGCRIYIFVFTPLWCKGSPCCLCCLFDCTVSLHVQLWSYISICCLVTTR